MSNRSRGRHRFDVKPEEVVDPFVAEQSAEVDEAFEAFDTGDNKTGLAKLVDVVLRDRDHALAKPDLIMPTPAEPDTTPRPVDADAIREATAYELAVLQALGSRETTIDRSQLGGMPMVVPVAIASGGMYGGTVEPWRKEERRRRNKAARRARKGRAAGRVRGSVRHGVRGAVPGAWQA